MMPTKTSKQKCAGETANFKRTGILTSLSRGPGDCPFWATHEVGGKPYCGRHKPKEVEKQPDPVKNDVQPKKQQQDQGGRDRGLLHINKLDDFKVWMRGKGYMVEDPKGDYEVLRLRKGGKPPLMFFTNNKPNPQHVTSYGPGLKMVRSYLRSTKKG